MLMLVDTGLRRYSVRLTTSRAGTKIDPKGEAARREWVEVKDDLLAGREPQAYSDGLTVADLCNEFLTYKEEQRNIGELKPRTFAGYYATCKNLCNWLSKKRAVLDLRPADFQKLRAKIAITRKSPNALGNEIQRVKSIFLFAFDQELIDRPVKFGRAFSKPKREVVRRAREEHRTAHGDIMFEAHELRLILSALDGEEVTLSRTDKKLESWK